MSTKPEAGSPDELPWLRGFEEARNHFLAENARLRKALEEIASTSDSDFLGKWVSEYMLRDIARAALEDK